MHQKQRSKSLTHSIMVIVVVIALLILSSPVYATKYNPSYLQATQLQQLTPTPVTTATIVTEQIIQEGRPVGIVIGAVGLVVIILVSAALFLPKRDPKLN